MKIDAQILNKTLATPEFNSTLKVSYTMIKWDLSLRYKDGDPAIYNNLDET